MKKIISLAMMLAPCSTVTATDCRVVEYPDHYEVACVGDAERTPASAKAGVQEGTPAQEQSFAAPLAAQGQLDALDAEPEIKIVRSELARRHGESWLKTMPRQ